MGGPAGSPTPRAPPPPPTPTSRPARGRRRRGSRPLTTHFLPRKVKRDSFSCGVSSRDPTLATLRGGGCWPELMVPPARPRVRGRLLRRAGERAFPSVTGREEGSHRLGIAQLLRRREEAAAAAAGRRSRRRAARRKGSPRLPPGQALAALAAVLAPRRPRYAPRSANPPPPAAAAARSNMAAGRARPRAQGAGERAGNARLRAGRPGRTTPRAAAAAAAGSRRAAGPRPLPAEGAPRGRTGAAGLERGPPRVSPVRGSGLRAAAGRDCWSPPRRWGPLCLTRTDTPAKLPCGPRPRSRPFPWGAAAGRHPAVEPGAGGTPGDVRCPAPLAGLGRSRRCRAPLPAVGTWCRQHRDCPPRLAEAQEVQPVNSGSSFKEPERVYRPGPSPRLGNWKILLFFSFHPWVSLKPRRPCFLVIQSDGARFGMPHGKMTSGVILRSKISRIKKKKNCMSPNIKGYLRGTLWFSKLNTEQWLYNEVLGYGDVNTTHSSEF